MAAAAAAAAMAAVGVHFRASGGGDSASGSDTIGCEVDLYIVVEVDGVAGSVIGQRRVAVGYRGSHKHHVLVTNTH
jgi:hypothetical protein